MKEFLTLLWKSSTKFEKILFFVLLLISLSSIFVCNFNDFIICVCSLICVLMFASIKLILMYTIHENDKLKTYINTLINENNMLHERLTKYENNDKLKKEIEEDN